MPIVSIGKFLNGPDPRYEALFRFTKTVMSALRRSLSSDEHEENRKYLDDIARSDINLSEDSSAADILVLAGTVGHAIENHNHYSTMRYRTMSSEMQTLVEMLTQSLARISSGSVRTVKRLEETRDKLTKAADLNELRSVRTELRSCLDLLEAEVVQSRKETAETVARLSDGLEQSSLRMKAAGLQATPLSALPPRMAAEEDLQQLMDTHANAFVAVFRMSGLDVVNARYGHEIGNEILRHFAAHLSSTIRAGDRIYRWNGQSFVVVLPRRELIGKSPPEMERAANANLEREFLTRNRAVLLPIRAAWVCLKTTEFAAAQLLIARVDEFLRGSNA